MYIHITNQEIDLVLVIYYNLLLNLSRDRQRQRQTDRQREETVETLRLRSTGAKTYKMHSTVYSCTAGGKRKRSMDKQINEWLDELVDALNSPNE